MNTLFTPSDTVLQSEAEREQKLKRNIEILVTLGIDPSHMRVTPSFAQFLPKTHPKYLDWRDHNPGYWAGLIEKDGVVVARRKEREAQGLRTDTLAILDAMTADEKSDLRLRIGK